MTLKPGLGSLKVIGTDRNRRAAYDFLLTFHSKYGPISYCFRDKQFSFEIAIFPPLVFNTPAIGVSLGIGYWRWGSKTRMIGLPGREISLTIFFSRVDTTHKRDGRTPGDSKDSDYAHSVARPLYVKPRNCLWTMKHIILQKKLSFIDHLSSFVEFRHIIS